jgi:hypothetical protein
MKLRIRLVGDWSLDSPIEDVRAALAAAAQEIRQLNVAMGALLENGPIRSDPDSSTLEGYLGDCNTPPVLGYTEVLILGYRKLIIPPGISPTTFQFVFGSAVETVADPETGEPVDVWGGVIQ